jgi:hypothetical protein
VDPEWVEKPDITDRLVDLHNYGLTDYERCEMRKEAWAEIRRLRFRVDQLEELNEFRVHQINERPR